MIALVVLLGVVTFLNVYHVPVYSITPGNAESVASNISVSGLRTDPHHDRIMLTDVYINSLTAGQWLLAQFQPHTGFINASELLSPGIPAAEFDQQGYVDMAYSKEYARVAALSALGWKVPTRAVGATVYAVIKSSPAWNAHLHVGDRIVSINGVAVHNSCDVAVGLHSSALGAHIALGVRSATISSNGVITLGEPHVVQLVTAKAPKGLAPSSCPGDVSARSVIGIDAPYDAVAYALPGSIQIATPDIGGPSAGLAMTLALIDRLSAGSLTGTRVVAATGTIDAQGHVGDVGGVTQKTVAVENAGASVFLVPQVELTTAQAASNGKLKVLGVSTLAQALQDLRRLGGDVPVPLTKPYLLKFAS